MKKSIHILGALTIAVALTAGFTACSNEDNLIEEQQTSIQAPVFHASIPASLDGNGGQTRAVEFSGQSTISSIFRTTENVYVYNETKQAMACDGSGNAIALHPSALSADGKRCMLTGDLTFYKYENSSYVPVDIEATDTYSLFYQMNLVDTDSPQWSQFNFFNLLGTADDASNHDFAQATGVTLTISGNNTLTVDNVNFQLMQSMFRQHLTFVDENGDEISPAPTIRRLKIQSKNNALVNCINPIRNSFDHSFLTINDFSGSDLYLALTFHYDVDHPAEGDKLIVIVTDTDGKTYYCTKNVPQNGFVNGKYYVGTMTLKYEPIVCTNNCYEPVVKNAQGKYILEDGGKYIVQGTVNGDIEGSGEIDVDFEDGSVINGCVTLQSIYDGEWKYVNINTSYYGTVTINNPGEVALQAADNLPTYISIGEKFVVNGNVSGYCSLNGYYNTMQVEGSLINGSYYLAESCFLKVKGEVCGEVTIVAAYDEYNNTDVDVTQNYYLDQYGYKTYDGGTAGIDPDPEPEEPME